LTWRVPIFPVGGFISDGGQACLKIRSIEWHDDAGKMGIRPLTHDPWTGLIKRKDFFKFKKIFSFYGVFKIL